MAKPFKGGVWGGVCPPKVFQGGSGGNAPPVRGWGFLQGGGDPLHKRVELFGQDFCPQIGSGISCGGGTGIEGRGVNF